MSSRRDFIRTAGTVSSLYAMSALCDHAGAKQSDSGNIPNRPATSTYMGNFAAEKIPEVKCAFIGVGARGTGHCNDIARIPGVKVVAICDLFNDLANRSVKNSTQYGHKPVAYSGDDRQYLDMLKEQKPDAVFVSTNWNSHARIAIDSMLHGAHVFVEVPIAVTTDQMWQIVDTSEKTQRHCMMMENVNYGRQELAFLNMCRQSVIGQLLHGEAAYIHGLLGQMNQVKRGTGSWRTVQYAKRNGNLYPTHGLGPVAQYMNLAREEDNFGSIVSFSSPALGRNIHAKAKFPADHKWNKMDFVCGDINTSIIKTVLGRTIMVQWDETSHRPYSRHNLIQGTKGTLAGFPDAMSVKGIGKGHNWITDNAFDKQLSRFEHPLLKRLTPVAEKLGLSGHGGMDGIMRLRIIECLQKGLPLDQNVYEGCLWSVVAPLSEQSVANGGMPVKFPDFTRGDWKTTPPLAVVT